MASTTVDTDTELSAVNAILGAIGQSPVTSIVFDNPEISFIYNLLRDSNVDVQSEGWHFNTEKHVAYSPDATTKKIPIGNDILRMDVHDNYRDRKFDVVKRGGYLYDKYDHTDEWDGDVDLDIVKLFSFEDIPPIFKRYIIYRASRMAATQLVSNPQLVQLIGAQEQQARAACLEYECDQGDYSMFGLPEDTTYASYQPWRVIAR